MKRNGKKATTTTAHNNTHDPFSTSMHDTKRLKKKEQNTREKERNSAPICLCIIDRFRLVGGLTLLCRRWQRSSYFPCTAHAKYYQM